MARPSRPASTGAHGLRTPDRPDARAPTGSRAHPLLDLQATAGNRAVTGLIDAPTVLRQEEGATSVADTPAPSPGAAAFADAVGRYSTPVEPFELGGYRLRTYLDAAAALRGWAAAIDLDRAGLASAGIAEPEEAARRRAEALEYAHALSDGTEADALLDRGNAADVRALYADIVTARNAMRIRSVMESDRMRGLRAQAADVSRIPARLDGLVDSLRAAQHAYFRAGDEDNLAKVTNAIGPVLLSRAQIVAAGAELREIEASARRWAAVSAHASGLISIAGTLGEISQAVKVLGQVNDAVGALTAALTLVSPDGVSEAAEARSAVGAWANLAAAGGALAAGTAFTGYFMYVTTLTGAILDGIGTLEDRVAERNTDYLALGGVGVNWRVEPGGKPMFDFAVGLMRASGRGSAPVPRGSVNDYLVEHRSLLQAGMSDSEELPTTGFWFWRDTDPDAAAGWAYDRREQLWRLLYGDRPVPTPRQYRVGE